MLAEIQASMEVVKRFSRDVDPDTVGIGDAKRIAEIFIEYERVVSAQKAAYALRAKAEDTASWLAETAGTSLSDARREAEFARKMRKHREIGSSFSSGEISKEKALQAARAAEVDPANESVIVAEAKELTYGEFSDRSKRRIERSMSERTREELEARWHRQRFLSLWIDPTTGSGRIGGHKDDLHQLEERLQGAAGRARPT